MLKTSGKLMVFGLGVFAGIMIGKNIERKRTAKALRENKQKLLQLVDHLQDDAPHEEHHFYTDKLRMLLTPPHLRVLSKL